MLDNPVSKERFRRLVKLKVTEYWQHVLAEECSSPDLTSLRHFDPYKASLTQPHPIWTCSAGNSFECSKSIVLARMVSGRYRTERMCRFWSSNRSGHCLAETCQGVDGDLQHLLVECPALDHIRHRLHSLWCLKTADCHPLHKLILSQLGSSPETQVRFILDCVACPEVIRLCQLYGREILDRVMYLTRTWAFAMHKHKMILLGRWPESKPNGKNSRKSSHEQLCLRAPDPNVHPPEIIPIIPFTNTPTFSGSGLDAGCHNLHLDCNQDVVQGMGRPSLQPSVLHIDKPPVVPALVTTNAMSWPASGVVGSDNGWCGDGEGDVGAACGTGGDTCIERPVTAFEKFSLSFHNSAVRLAGSLAGS